MKQQVFPEKFFLDFQQKLVGVSLALLLYLSHQVFMRSLATE